MPPPRLPRHLRPCHSSGIAHQARCASKTARVKFSTDGDDARQSSSSAGDSGKRDSAGTSSQMQHGPLRHAADQVPDAQKKRSSWWSVAMSNLASFGFKTTSAEPNPSPAQSPTATSSSPSEPRKKTMRSEGESTQAPRKQDNTDVSQGKSSTETPSNEDVRVEEGAITVQQQLQQLFDQVKTLQTTLEARTLLVRPQSIPATASAASATDAQVPHMTNQSEAPTKRPKRPKSPIFRKVDSESHTLSSASCPDDLSIEVQMPPRVTQSGERTPQQKSASPSSKLLARAWVGYRRSVFELSHAANALEDMPSCIVAPITSRVVHRLNLVAQDAIMENDFQTKRALRPYRGTVESSVIKLYWLKSPKSPEFRPNRYELILQIFAQGYRSSTTALIDAARTLDELRSSALAPMALLIYNRLCAIARDAKFENDAKMASVLRRYHNPKNRKALHDGIHYSPKMTKLEQTRASSPVLRFTTHGENPDLRASDEADLQVNKLELQGMSHESALGHEGKDDKKADDKMAKDKASKIKNDAERLTRQIQRQSSSMSSSGHSDIGTSAAKIPAKPPVEAKNSSKTTHKTPRMSSPSTDEVSEQSLLEELFPEASSPPQSRYSEKRDQYPKLDLPDSTPIIHREFVDKPKTLKEQVVEAFQKKGEQITVLQLAYCSTELTEADFGRLIPKGKHIESWRRDGEFYKIIPGRDPLSLERMPLYYILFKDPASALAYQKNVSRLHKLSALHQASDIFSAIPPPKGFLEDGEDLNNATSSYNLLPTHHHLSLSTLMQPYNPALRALIERGGYRPIVPDTDSEGKRVWKVLMHLESHGEPTPYDLFKIFRRDAYKHGMSLALRNESSTSIHRLRDIVNLKTNLEPISSRSFDSSDHDVNASRVKMEFEDPGVQFLMAGAEEASTPKDVHQMVMNRVYNRWVIDFGDEDTARRFANTWHRREVPDLVGEKVGGKNVDEVRMCTTEVLW